MSADDKELSESLRNQYGKPNPHYERYLVRGPHYDTLYVWCRTESRTIETYNQLAEELNKYVQVGGHCTITEYNQYPAVKIARPIGPPLADWIVFDPSKPREEN